jgi:ubiquinone/menaquinone biosynthesis C-methylase UbiE
MLKKDLQDTHTAFNQNTVETYSKKNSAEYDDQKNREFLYGKLTVEFLQQIPFDSSDRVVLDIGCGTGLGFEVTAGEFAKRNMMGIGIEPAGGMLDLAIEKFKNDPHFSWKIGSFEKLPVDNKSADKIISTLALHWVTSLEVAAVEMERVVKDTGSIYILMMAKDDGHYFKKSIVKALRKHLNFEQLMRTAGLALRVNAEQLKQSFAVFDPKFDIEVKKVSNIVYGNFDDHMKWWKARSAQIISDVKDKEAFMGDLRDELEKTRTPQGIPFDSNLLHIAVRGKNRAAKG